MTVTYEEALQKYEPTFGLETHVELGTTTKMFCGCITTFGAEPNTHTCPVCLGLPGSLPVINERAIEYTIKIGLALNCSIASWCRFAQEELLLPGHAEELPDLPVRRAAVHRRVPGRGHRRQDRAGRHRAGAHGGGHRQVAARRRRDRAHPGGRVLARRLQPGGHPAGRDRHPAGAGHRVPRPGGRPRVRHRAARRAALAGRLGRADGGRLAALRREHVDRARRLGRVGNAGPRPRT